MSMNDSRNLIFWSESLSVGYGPLQIVFDASIKVYTGALCTIIGPNGSGKSTLVKGLMGLAKVFGGGTFYEGLNITHSPTNRRVRSGIGIVPQVSNVFTNLSINENLEMGGYGLDRHESKERAKEMLELFPELEARKSLKASTLSGGERQMLAVARALMI